MNRLLTRWDLLGISFVILVGTALHFAFALSGYWTPMALVAPVNESVWEHFKLAFWPALLWSFLENAKRTLNARAFWSAKGFALLVIPILIATFFYGYTAVLGRNIFALDIATFVIAVVATQLASAQLLKADIHTRWRHSIGISLLLCQIAAYSTFTYYPPPVGLFEDGRNGTRGIPPNAIDTVAPAARVGGITSSSSNSGQSMLRNVEEMEPHVFAVAKELPGVLINLRRCPICSGNDDLCTASKHRERLFALEIEKDPQKRAMSARRRGKTSRV